MTARARIRLAAVALVLLSSGGTLLALELALRIRRGDLFGEADPTAGVRMLRGGYPARHDPLLGYVPEPGARLRDPKWGEVAIDAQGLRENGGPAPAAGATLLAVGDSYTWGDEVNDRDTWPAALERRLGLRVANGGVFGYGFDQIVLRAEALLPSVDPDVVIASLIPDDVARVEYSYRFAHRPYFALENGALALRNTPVPGPDVPAPGENAWRRALRQSFLGEFVVHRLDPTGWLVRGNVRAHRDGVEVARRLADRLADAAQAGGHALLWVAAWHPGARDAWLDPVRERAAARGLPLLELGPLLRREIEARGGDWSPLFFVAEGVHGRQPGHMTPQGNALVADAIAGALREHGLLGRSG